MCSRQCAWLEQGGYHSSYEITKQSPKVPYLGHNSTIFRFEQVY
jgi:hypothetical protein